MNESCHNCWWYCHSDSKCFRNVPILAVSVPKEMTCEQWAYDGLEDWERDECESEPLMTVER